MSEEFLSQEEIDALLGGGKEEKEEKSGVHPFDFSQVEHIRKGGIPGLELLFERWVKIYRESIRRLVPQVGMITKESLYITRFNSFISKIPMPASYNVVSMRPFKESFLLVLDSRLVFVIISVMFGGPAKPFKIEGREFTKLETKVIEDIVKLALESFKEVWENVYPVEIELKGMELNPTLARVVSGNEKVIVVECSMDIDGYEAPFFFCFPYGMFMPIKEIIFSEALFAERDPVWENYLKEKLLKTKLKVSLELVKKKYFLREILAWKVGEKLSLDVSKDSSINLLVEGRPKFLAKLGKVRNHFAALIQEEVEKDGRGREESRGASQGMGRGSKRAGEGK